MSTHADGTRPNVVPFPALERSSAQYHANSVPTDLAKTKPKQKSISIRKDSVFFIVLLFLRLINYVCTASVRKVSLQSLGSIGFDVAKIRFFSKLFQINQNYQEVFVDMYKQNADN